MKLGFTGTRKGMTSDQAQVVNLLLDEQQPAEVHHGCCLGADADFAGLCLGARIRQVGHPGNIEVMVSRTACGLCDELRDPLPPLERNRLIVEAVDALIATPAESVEQQRGGTWSTVRQARRMKKRLWIICPDGTVCEEF